MTCTLVIIFIFTSEHTCITLLFHSTIPQQSAHSSLARTQLATEMNLHMTHLPLYRCIIVLESSPLLLAIQNCLVNFRNVLLHSRWFSFLPDHSTLAKKLLGDVSCSWLRKAMGRGNSKAWVTLQPSICVTVFSTMHNNSSCLTPLKYFLNNPN